MSRPSDHAGANPYDLLGVPADACQQEIVRAYHRAVRQAHPDAWPGDPEAASRLIALTDAYAIVRDPRVRARYDREHPRRPADDRRTASGASDARPPGGSPEVRRNGGTSQLWIGPVVYTPAPGSGGGGLADSGPLLARDDEAEFIVVERVFERIAGMAWSWFW